MITFGLTCSYVASEARFTEVFPAEYDHAKTLKMIALS